jgi:Cu/Ag efflux pump CusA
MLRWIVGTSMRARGFVAVIAAVLIGLGVWQARSMRADALPEFTPPTVEIQTEALGLSAPEVEQLITVPLEQDLLAGVPWLDTMRSSSIPGLSSIELVFDPGTDLLRARQVVQERLTQAAGLPNVSGPPQMLQPLSSTSRVMMVRFSSASVTPIELSVLARWLIRPKILGVEGVANVSIWGQRERQLQVQVDPDRLRSHGLTLDEVIETSGNALWASPLTFLEASTPGTGGFIDTAQQRLGIQHLQPITTADDLAEVPIENASGTTLQLGDVADVVEDHQPLIGDAIFADGDPGLLLVIDKFPGTNTVDVTRGIEEAIDALRPGLTGVDVDTSIYRPATAIESGGRTLGVVFLLGLLFAIIAIGVLLYEWRSAVVVVVGVLTSLAVAMLVLAIAGLTLNALVLAGLAMGLVVIVDDAVVDSQGAAAMLRQRRMNGVEPHVETVLRDTLVATRTTMLFALAIAAVVVIPLFFMRGVAAPFVPPAVRAFGLAVVASLLVALVVTPALALLLLPGAATDRREAPVGAWVVRGYDRALGALTGRPGIAAAGVATLAVAGVVMLPLLVGTTLPSVRDGNVLVDLHAVPGTSLPEMDRISDRIEAELAALPGVADVGAHIGRAISSDQVVGVDAAQLWVHLDPASDYDDTLASVRSVVAGYPGLDETIKTYADERIAQVLSSSDAPIVVRVYGHDAATLQDQAEQVRDALAGVQGIADPRVGLQPQEPTIDVRVDLAKAERFGIVPGDVRRAAATLMSGIGVGSLFEEQKVFDVVVWGTPATRASLGSVQDLMIDTSRGGHVRLGDVADVAIEPTEAVITHQDLSRSLDVTANVDGRGVDDVRADVEAAIAGMAFPLEYHAELVADDTTDTGASSRAIAVVVAAVLGVILLLQAALGSWRLTAVAALVVPVAAAGSLIAAEIAGGEFSLGSLLGTVATLTLSARFALLLFRQLQQLQRGSGDGLDLTLVSRGARARCISIVTTTVVLVLAFVPVMLASGVEGAEVVRPTAVAILGGVIAAALLSLFALPALYLRFAPHELPETAASEVVIVPQLDPVPES